MKEFIDKLIERLEEYPTYSFGVSLLNTEEYIKVSDVKDIVNELAKEYKGGWIPCSERLPENYETVNITWINRKPESYYADIKDKPFTGTAIYHYGKWYWYSCVCEDYLKECGDSYIDRMDKDIEVIAWQPLPKCYTEGE